MKNSQDYFIIAMKYKKKIVLLWYLCNYHDGDYQF